MSIDPNHESAESTPRQKAREALRAGKLPRRCPERTWAGPGSGAPCAICSELVKPAEVEYELEFARGDGDAGLGNRAMDHHRVHLRCLAAFELELEQDRVASRSQPAGASASCAGNAECRGVLPGRTDDVTITDREHDAAQRRGSS